MKNVIFVRAGSKIVFASPSVPDMVDHIPAAVYVPFYNPMEGVYGLNRVSDKFEQNSSERFGDFNRYKASILQQYHARAALTGVLALGAPGSGKTLMAEDIGNNLIAYGLPVLYINSDFPIPILHEILKNIGACMVFVDEFGKNYPSAIGSDESKEEVNRSDLLTLLSDASLKKVLFYAASNKEDRAPTLGIMNRPSRFLLHIDTDILEVSSYIEQIEKTEMPHTLRETLLLNVLNGNQSGKETCWSSDALRVMLSMVKKDDTLSTLRRSVEILNVPKLHNNQLRLVGSSDDNELPTFFDSGKFSVERTPTMITLKWEGPNGVVFQDTVAFDMFEYVRERVQNRNNPATEKPESGKKLTFNLGGYLATTTISSDALDSDSLRKDLTNVESLHSNALSKSLRKARDAMYPTIMSFGGRPSSEASKSEEEDADVQEVIDMPTASVISQNGVIVGGSQASGPLPY